MTVVRVLIVDDQAPFLSAMRAVVGATPGFASRPEASSGEKALVQAGALLPDLVLIDVNLPGIDGLEVTRRLREPPIAPRGAAALDLRRGRGRTLHC